MTISVDALFRVLTIILFLVWWFYWIVTEKTTDREKPKAKQEGSILRSQVVHRFILRAVEGIMVLQVIILQLFPLPFQSVIIQLIGFTFVLSGVSLSISARKTLGTNWVHAYEYQVKKEQELVTTGVYSHIRHPIYSGLCFAFIGGELVAQSYLVSIGILLLIGGYWQARKEESLLVKHFGASYSNYMNQTKMFIPFLW